MTESLAPTPFGYIGTHTKYNLILDTPARPSGIRLHILISKEDDEDQHSVVALNLPGCSSYGDTAADAKKNIREAAIVLVESYEADGEQIPWKDTFSDDIPKSEVILLYA